MTAYDALTAACRERLLADLAEAPCSDVLIAHFERGKMLRSRLVFTAADALGGRPSGVVAAAVAIELLHGASLIHDDIIDGAARRRGLAAVHRRVAPGSAIVLGDYLLLRAFTTLSRARQVGEEERAMRAMALLSRHAEDCCRGQVQELEPASQDCGEDEYLALVRGKTGSQFALAAQLVPVLAGAREDDVAALGTFGLELGTAFQIQDDTLDLLGEARSLGKPVGNSLVRGRPTLPLIYLRTHGSDTARAELRALRRRDAAPAEVGRLLEQEGMIALARATQQAHLARAVEALERLRASDAATALAAFASTVAGWAPAPPEPLLAGPDVAA